MSIQATLRKCVHSVHVEDVSRGLKSGAIIKKKKKSPLCNRVGVHARMYLAYDFL